MASSSGGGIVKLALLAGGAYLIWQEFFANSSTTAAAATTTTPPAGTPPAGAPPATVQLLQNAAGAGVTNLTADQWSFYWQTNLGKTPIDPQTFGALFFPNGRPTDLTQIPTMNANQFVAAIATKGISGYRGVAGLAAGVAQPLWLPVILQRGGRRPMISNYRRRSA
jgi:hypothetical protein